MKNNPFPIHQLKALRYALCLSLFVSGAFAQSGGIQSLESFDYNNNTPLDSQVGGWGWMGGWVASDATAVATYMTGTGSPFSYANPGNSSYYVSPGKLSGTNTEGKIVGRYFDTSPTGPYSSWVDATGSLGGNFTGDMGFLLRKIADDDSKIFFGLSDGLLSENLNAGIGIGYFGPVKSNYNGKRYWTIKWNDGTYVRTDKEIVANKDEFFILRVSVNNGSGARTIDFYSDALIQNGWSATALPSNTLTFKFKSVFYYGEGGNSVDEIRSVQATNLSNLLVYDPSVQPFVGTNAPGPGTPGVPSETNKWKLDGNESTDPATQFIGTTDNKDFKIRTNNIERITITKDGKVGIGTSTPNTAALLDVNGLIKTTGLLLPTGAAINKVLTSDATGNASWAILPASSQWVTGGSDISYSTGKVGIGTATPDASSKLDVSGTIKATGILLPTGAGINKLLTSDASGNASWHNPQWTTNGTDIGYNSGGLVGIGLSSGFHANLDIYDGASSASPRMYVRGDNGAAIMGVAGINTAHNVYGSVIGDVIIGSNKEWVANPENLKNLIINSASATGSIKFGVRNDVTIPAMEIKSNGVVAIKNRIDAPEFRACLNAGSGDCPPDYVFDSDYKLMGLDTLKAYLAKNKHLPEVPSAKEMLSNGLDMKAMNMTLLKKVEELTLYILKQEEELKGIKLTLSKIQK